MTLLLPLALLGLLTLPAILLLHLLRNRRQELPISSLRLWQGLQRARSGGLPRHIPLSLMLLLQLLIAVALTLALARPALSFVLGTPAHTTFILDISGSMLAGSGFEQARQFIADQLNNLRDGDSAAVVSLGPEPQIVLAGSGAQKATLLLALDNLTPGETGVNLSAALSLANGLINSDRTNRIIIVTDGHFAPDPARLPAALAPVEWQLVGPGPAANQALFDVASRPLPNGDQRIFARAVNYSDAPARRTLRLLADGQPFAETTVDIAAESDATALWTLPAGTQAAAVEIVEADALPADNRADLFLANRTTRRVLLVSDSPVALARAFEAQPGVALTVAAELPPEPDGVDLLVLDGLPPALTAWPRGNVLVINPPLRHSLLGGGSFARAVHPTADSASPLLAGIDLSGVYFERTPNLALPEWAKLDLAGAAGENSVPLIFHGQPRNGSNVMVWAFDLSASNLPNRLALPLLTAGTLNSLLAPSPPAVVGLGQPVSLLGNFSVELPDGHRLFLESAAETQFSRTRQPGLYKIYNDNNELVAGFAVQAGSPEESNLNRTVEPVSLAVQASTAPNIQTDMAEYWPWLVAAALLLIVTEGWLAWRK